MDNKVKRYEEFGNREAANKFAEALKALKDSGTLEVDNIRVYGVRNKYTVSYTEKVDTEALREQTLRKTYPTPEKGNKKRKPYVQHFKVPAYVLDSSYDVGGGTSLGVPGFDDLSEEPQTWDLDMGAGFNIGKPREIKK